MRPRGPYFVEVTDVKWISFRVNRTETSDAASLRNAESGCKLNARKNCVHFG